MASSGLSSLEKRIRLYIYEFILETDRCPSLNEISAEAGLTPLETEQVLRDLEVNQSAIVLSPGSGNIWLADPFAALPTPYPVVSGSHQWFGMCVWDALGILVVADTDGHAPTRCPVSGDALELKVEDGTLASSEGVVHFAVPASQWWENIGFT